MFNNLTGRPTYNGGASFAPNRGSVGANGAKGYMKRELRKRAIQQSGGSGPFGGVSRFGGDGASDTRSGIAGRMLRPMMGGGKTSSGGFNWGKDDGRPMQTKGSGDPFGGPDDGRPMGGVKSGGSNYNWGKDDGRPMQTKGSGDPFGGPDDGRPMQGAKQPPHVTISADGTLKLPFDYQHASQAIDAQRQLNDQLLQLQMASQQAQEGYLSGIRQNEQNYAGNSRQALNTRASQGSAYSSAYGNDVAGLATDFNNQKANLDTNLSHFNDQAGLQKTQAVNYMNDLLQQLAVEQAQRLHDQAGSLGYGKVGIRKNHQGKKGGKKK